MKPKVRGKNSEIGGGGGGGGGVREESGEEGDFKARSVRYLRNEWDLLISVTESAKPGNGSVSQTHTARKNI